LYERPDTKEDKISDYVFYPIEDIALFLKVFGGALKTEIVVNKTRQLYMYENARIHVDTVDELGKFIEIEVVIDENAVKTGTQRDPHQIMDELVKAMEIKDEDRITCGYRELLLKARREQAVIKDITTVKDLNYYHNQEKIFWVVNETINSSIKANDIVPCIYVEKKDGGTLAILQLDLDIAKDDYKYTAWRKFIGKEYDIRVDVLLIAPDLTDSSKLQLYTLEGDAIQFNTLSRSDKIIDKEFLAKFARQIQ
jgi:hypothetical protein